MAVSGLEYVLGVRLSIPLSPRRSYVPEQCVTDDHNLDFFEHVSILVSSFQ